MLPTWRKRLIATRDWLSFSSSARALVDLLDREIESPEKLKQRVLSHPSGFVKSVSKRRLTMAESYIRLATARDRKDHRQRLRALEQLVYHASHAKTLSMPLNTARVQIALMKRCVNSTGNRRRQLEYMADFSDASYGQESVIRGMLHELDLIEVPDDGRRLKDMHLGWDAHVHDALSQGRKNPSELMLDAFIKGLSCITVVYYNLDPDIIEETLEAARILGVGVEIGIEFSVGRGGERVHFMYIPPQDGTVTSLRMLIDSNRDLFDTFESHLKENAQQRRKSVQDAIDRFNHLELPQLNDRFASVPALLIPPVSWDDIMQSVHGGQVSRIHIGMALAERVKPILHKRVLYLKNQYRHAINRLKRNRVSSWEVDHLRAEYEKARREYGDCNPFTLNQRFAARVSSADYDSAFKTVAELDPLLDRLGGRLAFIHPLSVGPHRAVRVLLENHRLLTGVETFNMSDSVTRDPADIRRLDQLVDFLSQGDEAGVQRLLQDWGIEGIAHELISEACRSYAARPLNPRCGSDYVGGHVKTPGMGFIDSRKLTKKGRKQLEDSGHPALPVSLGHHVLAMRNPQNPPEPNDRVFALSPPREPWPNLVGDELQLEAMGIRRFWRYANPNIKGLLKTAVGLLPAWYFVGPYYALLWLGITGFRNAMADLISASGFDLRSWTVDNINRTNLSNSLFWTGFSVPILGAAKDGFDWLWPLVHGPEGFLEALAKFWVISFANGAYISSHNRLRKFSRSVIRANFFRSVLSWPLATLGSYAFTPLGVPAIVQTKVWSDVVAGIIEGTGKFIMRLRLRQRDLLEMLRQLLSEDREQQVLAMADILYVWARRDRGKTALKILLRGEAGLSRTAAHRLSVRNDPQMIAAAYKMLLKSFTTEGNVEALTGAILSHYSGKEATVIVAFIGENHDRFGQWLVKNRPPSAAATSPA